MSAFEDSNHYEVCPTSPTNAGYNALMIGNGIYCDGSNLSGVNSDLILMKTVLTSSGYIVEFEENLDQRKIEETVLRTVERLKGSTFKSFLFYFSGHGTRINNIDYICPVDCHTGRLIEKALILQSFSSLIEFARKPKIFLFDCCRGSEKNPLLRANGGKAVPQMPLPSAMVSSSSSASTALVGSDCLIAYAIQENFVAFDSAWTPTLTKVLTQALSAESREATNLSSLLEQVNGKVPNKGVFQQPKYENTFRKALFWRDYGPQPALAPPLPPPTPLPIHPVEYSVSFPSGVYYIVCNTKSEGEKAMECFPREDWVRPRLRSTAGEKDQKMIVTHLGSGKYHITCDTANKGIKALEAFPQEDALRTRESSRSNRDQIFYFHFYGASTASIHCNTVNRGWKAIEAFPKCNEMRIRDPNPYNDDQKFKFYRV